MSGALLIKSFSRDELLLVRLAHELFAGTAPLRRPRKLDLRQDHAQLAAASLTYWTMGAPVEETIIINRCRKEETYEVRLAEGMLPG